MEEELLANEPGPESPEEGEAQAGENPVEKAREDAIVGLECFLGEGFDRAFFDSVGERMLPISTLNDGWNEFLRAEPEQELQERTIEFDIWTKIDEILSGSANAPCPFPVFILGLKNYYKSKNIPEDHITPERMRRFYTSVGGGTPTPSE